MPQKDYLINNLIVIKFVIKDGITKGKNNKKTPFKTHFSLKKWCEQ